MRIEKNIFDDERDSLIAYRAIENNTPTVVKEDDLSCVSYFFIGCLNNTGYVFVVSSALRLSERFGQSQNVGAFTLIMSLVNVIITLLNSKFLLQISHSRKIYFTLILSSCSYAILGLSNLIQNPTKGFILALIGTFFMGLSFTVGELTMLGYLKGFSKNVVTYWSSGTGIAGLFGTLTNLALSTSGLTEDKVFWAMIVTNIFYWICFKYLKNQRKGLLRTSFRKNSAGSDLHRFSEIEKEITKDFDSHINESLDWETIKLVWPHVGRWITNLGTIYIFEYMIITGFLNDVVEGRNDDPSDKNENFLILTICYQIGVFISRSSTKVIKIERIEVLTSLQFLNALLWGIFAKIKYYGFTVLSIELIFVGLLGGAIYANAVYFIMNDIEISMSMKEISVNLLNLFNFIGIIIGATLCIIMKNTIGL